MDTQQNCHIPAQDLHLKKVKLTQIPGDKSISHRAIILGSLAENTSVFDNFLFSEDCLNTLRIFQDLGVPILQDPNTLRVTIEGVGLQGLQKPTKALDVGNSGTGIRLITGVLAAQNFDCEISGDASIAQRPMKRISHPLSEMGARLSGRIDNGELYPPLHIQGNSSLAAIDYTLPVASAQVKSAVLLAGLFAEGTTTVEEPAFCRNHTEVMLKGYGYPIQVDGHTISLPGQESLRFPDQDRFIIPSDFSSAAFFIVLGCLLEDSTLILKNIGINSTRAVLIDVLVAMGANIELKNIQKDAIEPIADIHIESSQLTNISVPTAVIPYIIDEIPILAVAGCFGDGILRVRDAKELRVKESDRIQTILDMARAFGGNIHEFEDGFDLIGPVDFKDFKVDSHGDHRIAMSAIIGALSSGREGQIQEVDCIRTSFPNFFELLSEINATYTVS